MGSFGDQIRAFSAKAEDRLDAIVGKTVLEVRSRLIVRSPVGNPDLWKRPRKGYVGGRFRQSWEYWVDQEPGGEGPDATATVALPQLKDARLHVHFVLNRLPYARALEYGHSTQAPQGMVRIMVLEFQEIVDAATASVALGEGGV